MSDNFRCDIQSEGDKHLRAAIGLLWDHAPGNTAEGFRVSPEKGLIFYWDAKSSSGLTKLPFPMTADDALSFVKAWLRGADAGEEPDHDGSNHKGFRAYNEDWGHVDGDCYAFAAFKPFWMMYGK